MKKLLIVVVIMLTPSFLPARADVTISHVLNSFMVAKAEANEGGLNQKEIQKRPYTIQIASYLNEDDAISHVAELRAKHVKDVRYFPTFMEGQVWYKVAVGQFKKRSVAEEYKNKISKKFNEPFAVVINLLKRPSFNETYAPQNNPIRREPSATETKPVVAAPKIRLVPLVKAVEAHAVSAKKAAPRDHYYAIQIAAYATKSAAQKKVAKLGLKGIEVAVATGRVNGQVWHRVLVGHFRTARIARTYQKTKGGSPLRGGFVRRVNVH